MKTQISKIIFFISLSCAVFGQYNGFLRTAKMYEMQKNWDAAIAIYNDMLNKNPNKTVIAPKGWLLNDPGSSNVILSDWVKL